MRPGASLRSQDAAVVPIGQRDEHACALIRPREVSESHVLRSAEGTRAGSSPPSGRVEDGHWCVCPGRPIRGARNWPAGCSASVVKTRAERC